MIRYVSTRGAAPALGFDDVLLRGLAEDGGLYVPERWPHIETPSGSRGYAAVAAEVIGPYLDGSILEPRIEALTEAAYAGFRHPEVAPIETVSGHRAVMELFWGPTLSFKDYALQLVGILFDEVLAARGRRITVLGATSGDTGSAAIEACRDRQAIDIVILYPEGRISEVQRRQMTTVPSANVHAVAVDGTFDDCQDLVKAAFADEEVRTSLGLAAVNSINWARVMAQSAYYYWSEAQMGPGLAVSVPTGNFGNVLAATVAKRTGARLGEIVIGTNANHGLPTLIETGRMPLEEVVPTLAPAMDIQVPSNLERHLFELSGRDGEATGRTMGDMRRLGELTIDEGLAERLRSTLKAAWIDDAGIDRVINDVHDEHGYLLDPHTATAWSAADVLFGERPALVVSTAHPAKFPEAVVAATGVEPPLPEHLADLFKRHERTERVAAELPAVVEMVRRLTR